LTTEKEKSSFAGPYSGTAILALEAAKLIVTGTVSKRNMSIVRVKVFVAVIVYHHKSCSQLYRFCLFNIVISKETNESSKERTCNSETDDVIMITAMMMDHYHHGSSLGYGVEGAPTSHEPVHKLPQKSVVSRGHPYHIFYLFGLETVGLK
jgi:hypothetical protein